LNSKNIQEVLVGEFPNTRFEVTLNNFQVFVKINQAEYRFWMEDWLLKREVVLGIISSITGNNNRVFARNCEVKKINKELAKAFLDQNHLFGYSNAYHKYALYYKSEILAVITFSKGRKMNRLEAHQRSFELIAFSCKSRTTVVGGLSKLIKAFVNEINPSDIMTYTDLDWSKGQAYLKLGFKIHSQTAPQTYSMNKITYYKQKVMPTFNLYDETFAKANNKGNLKLVLTL
jgi:hypothetical protein